MPPALLPGAILTAIVLICAAGWAPVCAADDATDELFEAKIRPVLADVCLRCHGETKVSGGLRIDSRQALALGGDSGPAIVPGNADESLLVRALKRTDDVSPMPPDTPLRPEQVESFVAWVNAGAAWPETSARMAGPTHWAFEPVRTVALPEVHDTAWVRTSVDPFIRAAQEAAGVDPAPPADRRTLIRRATYDLTGLPPTADEVAAFENDPSPAAFETVVERLLHSPHYGEHWGRHWLDLVRYADTAGENTDHPLPHAWRYRNWVIQSVNDNMPYDRFVREQIAGDLLALDGPADEYADHVIATGYLAIARRFGHEIDKDIHLTIEDTIDTLCKSTLGLTVGCARCHDHKYDPLSVRDYYGLYGILASTRYAFPGCEPQQRPRDLVPLMPPDEYARTVKPLEEQLVALDAQIKQLTDTHAGESLAVAQQQRTELAAQTMVPVAYAVSDGQPANARIQLRGDPADLGDEVPRKFLDILGGQMVQSAGGSGRLELADWLTDPSNPLTARVFVNRVWQWHFGRGLVTTPNDFGTRGAVPTHPELLDHLAAEFVTSGWDVRALHRCIMLSATYQQASPGSSGIETGGTAAEPTVQAAPPELYAAFARRRLTAEELRDSLLMASGELDVSPGGTHPFPPEESWSFTQHNPFAAEYDTFKRSVYVMQKRNRRSRFFALFDGADTNATTPLRDVTTVPTQALYFMNDPFVHARAEKFAARVLASASNDDERVGFAFRTLFGRQATDAELADATALVAEYAAGLDEADPGRRVERAWAAYARVLLASNEFLYVD